MCSGILFNKKNILILLHDSQWHDDDSDEYDDGWIKVSYAMMYIHAMATVGLVYWFSLHLGGSTCLLFPLIFADIIFDLLLLVAMWIKL